MEYYDYDAQPKDTNEYDEFFVPADTRKWLEYVVNSCVKPSLVQFSTYVLLLFGGGLLCRFVWNFNFNFLGNKEWLHHLISLAFGLTVLYFIHGTKFLVLLYLILGSYALISIMKYRRNYRNMGTAIAVIVICSNLLHEILWGQSDVWHRIRGTQMVITMQIISFACDIEREERLPNKRHIEPGLIPYLGYLFCPVTVIIGPWISYSVYWSNIHSPPSIGFRKRLMQIVLNIGLAAIFISASNCGSLIFANVPFDWMYIFFDALTVRFSHYLICFASQSVLAISGFSLGDYRAANPYLGHLITNPIMVEFPRSLSSVVRNWNLPMHDWLKTYVFRSALNRMGNYRMATLATYFVSSLLHGCDTRIYLVLLSLGGFTLIETAIRAKLANIYDACIAIYPCRKPCVYKHCFTQRTGNKWIIKLVNILFSLLAIFHLAYLGVVMNSNVENFMSDTSFNRTFQKWYSMNYASHLIAFGSYVFYYFI